MDRIDRRGALAVAFIVAAGLAARAFEAGKSLWLDELHSTELAGAETLGAMVDILLPDFHAPLFFLALRPFTWLGGEDMRWVPLLTGMLTLIPLLSLAREARLGRPARIVLAATFALAPFQLRYGVELRPYAWLQLFSVVIAWAGLSTRGTSRTRFVVFAAATAVGLYVHYLTCIAVLAVGFVRLFVRGGEILRLDKLVLAGAVGVVLFLPWVVYDERWLLEDPGAINRNEALEEGEVAPPDPRNTFSHHRRELIQLPAQLVAPSVGSLGGEAAMLARVALYAFLAAAAVAAGALLRFPGRARVLIRPHLAAALVAATGLVLTVLMCVKLWERLATQYFVVGAWVWPLLLAAGVECLRGRTRVLTASILVVSLTALATAHVVGEPREDLERAVRVVAREAATRKAVVTAVMRQPSQYRHDEVFRVYAPDLDVVRPVDVAPGGAPDAPRTVIVLTRRTPAKGPGTSPDLASVRAGRVLVEEIVIDAAIRVAVFERP